MARYPTCPSRAVVARAVGDPLTHLDEDVRDQAAEVLAKLKPDVAFNAKLDAANAVIAHNANRLEKRLWSDLGDGEPVRVLEVEDEHAEARFVAAGIASLVEQGFAGDEIAIFYRTNALSRGLERECGRNLEAIWLMENMRPDFKTMADFLAAGAPVNSPNHYGITPLLQASRSGDAAPSQ